MSTQDEAQAEIITLDLDDPSNPYAQAIDLVVRLRHVLTSTWHAARELQNEIAAVDEAEHLHDEAGEIATEAMAALRLGLGCQPVMRDALKVQERLDLEW